MTEPPVQPPTPAPDAVAAPYFRADELKADLGGRVARGGVVTLSSQGFKFVAGMAATVVLARLLTPQDYGLVGMAFVVTGFIAMFKDLGLSSATIQQVEITSAQVSTLFWINLGLSLCVALLTLALAPAVAWFYGEPRLTEITMAYAGGFVLGGLTVQHEALLRRRMRFAALAAAEVASLVAGLAAAVLLAWRGAGYWALLANTLVAAAVYAAAVWGACRWRPSRPAGYGAVRQMVAFGRNLTGFTILNYFARNLDNLLIGRFWGSQQLGLYSKAYQLLLLPIDQISTPVTAVAVPALSRLTDAPARYRQAYLRILEKMAMVTMPGVALLVATSDWVVQIVLGPQWTEVGRIFALLGVVGLVQPVAGTTGWLFITQGRTRQMFLWGVCGSAITMASIVAGLPWGAVGVAFSYSVVGLCVTTPALIWYVGREGPVRAADICRAAAPSAVAACCVLLALFWLRAQVAITDPLLGLALAAALTLALTLSVLAALPAGRAALQDVGRLLGHLVKKREAGATW